jgi:3-mercaptopyruvate sulfurtransferase SseA
LPNYHRLVHPAWLKQLISGERPEEGPDGEWLLYEVAWDGGEPYQNGHIPGAHYLETTTLEKASLWNRIDDAALEERLLALGINREKSIVLYGRDPMAAARAAVILMYAGVSEVRLLDGGYAAWMRAGYPVESGSNKPRPAGQWGQTGPQSGPQTGPGRPEVFVDTAEVKSRLAGEAVVLVSVRSWLEFTGQISGYAIIQAKGRIAGAVWGQAGSDPHHMEAYRNGDNTMRNYHEIAAFWRAEGIIPDKQVIFSCGTGWRAAEAFFYAYLMGWPRISLYDGGWLEWSLDESNPVEVGEPGYREV